MQRIDPEVPGDLAGLENCFDTVLCLNVLEHLEDPGSVLESLAATIRPGGRCWCWCPTCRACYGSLDRKMGHKRRYSEPTIGAIAGDHGFAVEPWRASIRSALLPWWAYSKLLQCGSISKLVLKIFDKSVWFWRRLDVLMPWPGLSLVAVGRKPGLPRIASGADCVRETTQNAN